MIILEKCIKKEEKIIIIFSSFCPKMNLSASFDAKMRQTNRKWGRFGFYLWTNRKRLLSGLPIDDDILAEGVIDEGGGECVLLVGYIDIFEGEFSWYLLLEPTSKKL